MSISLGCVCVCYITKQLTIIFETWYMFYIRERQIGTVVNCTMTGLSHTELLYLLSDKCFIELLGNNIIIYSMSLTVVRKEEANNYSMN